VKTKHTPTPWKQDRRNHFSIVAADGAIVAYVSVSKNFGIYGPNEGLENARFIVRACNSYYELLKAAKTSLQSAESWIHDQFDGTEKLRPALDALQPVRDAIAAAEERAANDAALAARQAAKSSQRFQIQHMPLCSFVGGYGYCDCGRNQWMQEHHAILEERNKLREDMERKTNDNVPAAREVA
jgi:hypothetical protein